jgi:ATP-dependent DNA ligase
MGSTCRGIQPLKALLVGYYEDDTLLFVGKIRNGFVPSVKADVAKRFKGLETSVCPFANLPEPKNARRRMALTAEVMKTCRRAEAGIGRTRGVYGVDRQQPASAFSICRLAR